MSAELDDDLALGPSLVNDEKTLTFQFSRESEKKVCSVQIRARANSAEELFFHSFFFIYVSWSSARPFDQH